MKMMLSIWNVAPSGPRADMAFWGSFDESRKAHVSLGEMCLKETPNGPTGVPNKRMDCGDRTPPASPGSQSEPRTGHLGRQERI